MKKVLYTLITLLAVACSSHSPSRDGRAAAEAVNRCATDLLQAAQKLESDFVSAFNPASYTLRYEALEAYKKDFKELGDNFRRSLDEARIQASKLKGQYAGDYARMEQFDEAYDEAYNLDLVLSAGERMTDDAIPPAVVAAVNAIIPPKPDAARMAADLIGHSLSEGFDRSDCYFSEGWRLEFDKDTSVDDLVIERITDDDNREYSALVAMTVQKGNLKFDARAHIYYILPDGADWTIDFAKSQGVSLVSTHRFDDCISCEIAEDGWGGTYALYVTNTSEVELIVLGTVLADGERYKFNRPIAPGEKAKVGGLFAGGSVTGYDIAAVERI